MVDVIEGLLLLPLLARASISASRLVVDDVVVLALPPGVVSLGADAASTIVLSCVTTLVTVGAALVGPATIWKVAVWMERPVSTLLAFVSCTSR